MTIAKRIALISGLSLFSSSLVAEPATITATEGKVEILINPSKSVEGEPPRALYRGTYYTVRPAAIGMVVEDDQVLRTGRSAKSRLIDADGNVISLGANTAYRTSRPHRDEPSLMELLFGTIRAQVLKKRAKEEMKFRSRTMVIGVRGTDFYLSDPSRTGDSEVTVLRGAVEVSAHQTPEQTVTVATGQTGKVAAARPDAQAAQPSVEVSATPKQDILQIQTSTVIKRASAEDVDPETSARIQELEKTAVSAIVTDIRNADPETDVEIAPDMDPSDALYELNTGTLRRNFEKAPSSPMPGNGDRADAAAAQRILAPLHPPSNEPPAEEKVESIDDEAATTPPEDNGPSSRWHLKPFVAVQTGKYAYHIRGRSDTSRDGSSGGGYFGVSWQPWSWLDLGVRVGGRSLEGIYPDGGKSDLSFNELWTAYRHRFAWGLLGIGITLGEEEMIVFSPFAQGPRDDYRDLSFVLLSLTATIPTSETNSWFARIDYALGSKRVKARRVANLQAGYEHEPFSWPFAFAYGLEFSERELEFEEAEQRTQVLEFSRTVGFVRAGYVF